MPQFDPHSFFSQIFWFFLIFSILYFYIKNVFYPKMIFTLEYREEMIEGNENKTKAIEEIITNNQRSYQANLNKAYEEARLIQKESENKLKDMQNQILSNNNTEITKKIKEAEQKINNYLDNSRKELSNLSEEIIQIITQKYSNAILSKKTIQQEIQKYKG